MLDTKLSKFVFEDVEKKIRYKITGSVIKNVYIPESLCVIEEKADMGNLIFVRSKYTGLPSIVCFGYKYQQLNICKIIQQIIIFLIYFCA